MNLKDKTSPTKLFTTEQVKKFFSILNRLSGSIPIDKANYPWKNYQTIYTKDSKYCPCTREVFVHRTINKWLKNKYLIVYRVSDLGTTYKQYISLITLSYHNDWSFGYIRVRRFDYGNPYLSQIFNEENIKYNNALSLEGEWCNNRKTHHKLLKFSSMQDISDKEYVFKAYDWNKFKRKSKHNPNPKESIETIKSFIAKTEYQAYQLREKFEMECNEAKNQFLVGSLIEVKLINN